jgi:tRNA-dihydrouridine synthase
MMDAGTQDFIIGLLTAPMASRGDYPFRHFVRERLPPQTRSPAQRVPFKLIYIKKRDTTGSSAFSWLSGLLVLNG